MTVTKVVMPMEPEDYADDWGIVRLNKSQVEAAVSQEEDENDVEDESAIIEYGNSPEDAFEG
jgi:hypothetical protein